MGARVKRLPGKVARPTEAEVLRHVLSWLTSRRLFHWRNNSGARLLPGHGGKGQFVRWGRVGSGDVFVLLPPHGRLVSLECKRPGCNPTAAQQDWMRLIREAGGVAAVVTSVADVERVLREEGWVP